MSTSLHNTQPSVLSTRLLGLLLVAALVGSIIGVWNDPSGQARYAARQADSLLRQGRYLYATSLLERTLTTYDSPQARLSLSYAYLARHDTDRAERQARRVIDAGPIAFRSAAWAQLGRVLSYSGNDNMALDAWEKAIQTFLDPPGSLISAPARSSIWHIAITYWKRGDWPAARHNLEPLLGAQDIYAQAAMLKLAQLTAPDDPNLSHTLLDRLDKIVADSNQESGNPDPPQPMPDLRLPGLQEGISSEEALQAATALQKVHTQVADARKKEAGESQIADLWGTFYLQQGELRLAKQYLEHSISLHPHSADVHARLGATLLQQGDELGALSHLQTAISLDAQQPLPHFLLVQVYTGKGDWDKANAEFTTLRKLQPGSVELHLQLAEYYRLRGQYQEAEDEYIDAVTSQRIAPAEEQARSGVNALLSLSHFYTDVRGFGCEKGLPAATQSLATHPADPASLEAVGWSTALCHNPQDALSSLEAAVQRAPNVPRYRYHLAKTYTQLGRFTDARDQYTWVRDLDPTGPWEQLAISEIVTLPPEK